MKISKNNILKLSIFLSIICFFSLNIFSNNTFNRISLDTTQNNLYTISSGTKKFLKNLLMKHSIDIVINQVSKR